MQPHSEGLFSVVVVVVGDSNTGRSGANHLHGCLNSLARQSGAPPLEVIVPHHHKVTGLDELRQRFPKVTFLPCDDLKTFTGRGGSREHHDELRARGIAASRGEIVALLEDFDRPAAGWAAAMWEAHRQRVAGVGGAIDNELDRLLNWAVYFCDFGKYQNPIPAGETLLASDANVSYKRSALEAIRPVWQDCYREPAVNGALHARGDRLTLCPAAVVNQQRLELRFFPALRERFIWGRSFAGSRPQTRVALLRFVYAILAPLLPPLLLLRMSFIAIKRRRYLGAFVRALPCTAALTLSWSLGEMVGYVTGTVSSDLPVAREGSGLAEEAAGSPRLQQPHFAE